MADTLRRLLGWGKRGSLPTSVEDTAASSSGDQEQGGEVVIQQYGSLRHLRPGPRDKQQSLAVALLRAKQERLLSSRKRSASECCLHSAPAPLCAGESNVTLALETRSSGQLSTSEGATASTQSVPGAERSGRVVHGSGLPPQLSPRSVLRETQSCELMNSLKLGQEMSGVRKTASVTSAARIREDSNILRNIKKREVVSAMKGNTKSLSLGGLDRAASKKPVKTSFTLSMSEKHEPSWRDSRFISELLDWHNLLRARHGVTQLQLDTALCREAQNWANFLAHTNEFHYQNPKEYGENLLLWPLPILPPSSMAKKSPDVTGRYVATYWYRSHSSFPYHADPDVMQSYASAFTQMVWAGSQKFGCGKARSSNGKVIVVAYYHPRGNVPDKYHLNVVQPSSTDADNQKYAKLL